MGSIANKRSAAYIAIQHFEPTVAEETSIYRILAKDELKRYKQEIGYEDFETGKSKIKVIELASI